MINLFRNKRIQEPFFGDMGVAFDKKTNSYFLDKDIELEGVAKPISLYIESADKESTEAQRKMYQMITDGFSEIWKATVEFLVLTSKELTETKLKENYRLESITLPKEMDIRKPDWNLDILNLEDGFSRIVVEMEDRKPKHYSIEG